MHRPAILSVVLAALLAAGGCGTMANLDGRSLPLLDVPHQEPTVPLGGVGHDLRWICSGLVFYAADLPLSLVGDLATLPYVLHEAHEDEVNSSRLLPPDPAQQAINIDPPVIRHGRLAAPPSPADFGEDGSAPKTP